MFFPLKRHQAGQLSDGPGQEGQPGLHNRLRVGQKVQGPEDTPAHTVQGKQEPDRNRQVRVC